MSIDPLLRAYLQQPPADRALWLLFLSDRDQRMLQLDIMDALDVVQNLFMDILEGYHAGDPPSSVTIAQFATLMDALAEATAGAG